jgi:hypothetical protein
MTLPFYKKIVANIELVIQREKDVFLFEKNIQKTGILSSMKT